MQTNQTTISQSVDADALAPVFALLADPLRLRIVAYLADEQLCTCHLMELTGAKQSTISHHLRQLREAGLVFAEPVGRFTWYRLAPERFAGLADLLGDLSQPELAPQRVRLPCADSSSRVTQR